MIGRRILCAAIVAAISATGCVQNTIFNTDPDGAEMWINGQYMGTTPVSFRSRSGLPDSFTLKISKDGYETIQAMPVDKVLRADATLLLLVLAIVPYFFTARLEDQYTFKLKALPGTRPPAAATSGGAATGTSGGTTTPPAPPPPPPPPPAPPG
jgi:hypothetical protein